MDGNWEREMQPLPTHPPQTERGRGERESWETSFFSTSFFTLTFLSCAFLSYSVLSCFCFLSSLCVCVSCAQNKLLLLLSYFTTGWGKMGNIREWEGNGKEWEERDGWMETRMGDGKAPKKGLLGKYYFLLILFCSFIRWLFCRSLPCFLDVFWGEEKKGRLVGKIGGSRLDAVWLGGDGLGGSGSESGL